MGRFAGKFCRSSETVLSLALQMERPGLGIEAIELLGTWVRRCCRLLQMLDMRRRILCRRARDIDGFCGEGEAELDGKVFW